MDRESVTLYSSNVSCAILEMGNITKDYDKVLYQVASRLYHPARGAPHSFLMWSDVDLALVEHLKKKKWEKGITISNWAENPKTGNKVAVIIWAIPHKEFKAWYIKERITRFEKAMHNPYED